MLIRFSIRRWFRFYANSPGGLSPQGGRDHSSHRLASLGLDQRQVVWILWLLTAFGASLGIMIHLMPDALFAAGALLFGMLSMLALFLARLPGYPLPHWLRARVTLRAR